MYQFSKPETWTSFSPVATGWSSTSTNYGVFVVVGEVCFVHFIVHGTSNSTTSTINLPLPYTLAAPLVERAIRDQDAGGAFRIGLLLIDATSGPSTIAICYSDMDGHGWTASGIKDISGSFWYPVV